MKALRLFLYFVIGLLLGSASVFAFAGTYTSYQGSAFRTINGTTYWKGDAGTYAQSKATVIESIKVGNTYITVPTFAEVTGAMVAAGTGAVRMAPGLAGAALMAWLAQQGLEQIAGEWKKKQKAGADIPPASGDVTCESVGTGVYTGGMTFSRIPSPAHCGGTLPAGSIVVNYCYKGGTGCAYDALVRSSGCPTNYTLQNGGCVANTDYVPAGQSDWDAVAGVTPPDAVMREMCQALAKYGTTSAGCAMQNAATTKATSAMSDWSLNPNTGKMERQVATWTPRPTPSDPFAGEVSVQTEERAVGTATDPTTGSTTDPNDTTKTDKTNQTPFCTLYPDSVACAKLGEAEDPAKLDDTKQVSITPDAGFGPSDGQCPQDLTYTVHLTGTQLRMSYQPVCTGLRTFRPVIIGMAWVSGVLIFLGIARKAQG